MICSASWQWRGIFPPPWTLISVAIILSVANILILMPSEFGRPAK
jgi:hypothetical protein